MRSPGLKIDILAEEGRVLAKVFAFAAWSLHFAISNLFLTALPLLLKVK